MILTPFARRNVTHWQKTDSVSQLAKFGMRPAQFAGLEIHRYRLDMIPIFVISLPDSLERRENVSERLGALGLPFEFIDAVDGRKRLPPEFEVMVD